jgi:hypothetical protein
MGSFNASLRTLGDRRGLPATVTLDHGRISIEAGDYAIGEWSLDEVHLEPTGSGYRMAAEGEQIILEIQDSANFEIELRAGTGGRQKAARKAKEPRAKTKGRDAKPPIATERPAHTATRPARTKKRETAPAERRAETLVAAGKGTEADVNTSGARIDRVLVSAEKKWGSLLPKWVFTRHMVWLAVGILALTIVLPGLVSTILLLIGLILVLFGAVVYTDGVLAAKWLPGRMSAMHVLISGVGVLVFGVLIGTLA